MPARSQDNPNFNVDLNLNYTAAERILDLCDGRFVSTSELAALRGNVIAAATAQYISQGGNAANLLQTDLDSLKDGLPITADIFHLRETRDSAAAIREFLNEIEKSNFSRRITATVEQVFPRDARINASLPVYFVALGHENVDAYVRRISWRGDTPQFVGEHEGELTIVVNLARAIGYEGDMKEKFIQLLGTVAHEVFHAAFGALKDESPSWRKFYAARRSPFDALIDITQNEGIAYYLSIDQAGRGSLPRDWTERSQDVFELFNRNAAQLMSDSVSPRRARALIRAANLSGGDWQSYGAMTGMVMARAIDHVLGRPALVETIAQGPDDFFRKYLAACEQQGDLPRLSDRIAKRISGQ